MKRLSKDSTCRMGMDKSSAKWIVHAIKLKSVPNSSLSCLIAIPQKYQCWNWMWAEEENRTVRSAKLRMRVNRGVEKNIWRVFEEWVKGELGCMCGHADNRRHDTSNLMGYNYKASYHVSISTDWSQRHYLLWGTSSCTGHDWVQVVYCRLSFFLVQPISPFHAITIGKLQRGTKTYKRYQITSLWL